MLQDIFTENVAETFALCNILHHFFYVVSCATAKSNLAATGKEFQKMYMTESFKC